MVVGGGWAAGLSVSQTAADLLEVFARVKPCLGFRDIGAKKEKICCELQISRGKCLISPKTTGRLVGDHSTAKGTQLTTGYN